MKRVNVDGVEYKNMCRHARSPKDNKEQARINVYLLNCIKALQRQIDANTIIIDRDEEVHNVHITKDRPE